ncbi:MAG: hypothetical protein M3280_10435 [Actinomycetota bacterium]|nr:hypothetical protein [Actinomycetota bacterium]
MSEQLKAALIRGLIGAFFIFCLTFFTTLQSAPKLKRGESKTTQAAVSGAVAAFTYIVTRGGVEGLYDQRRQDKDDVKPGDVKKK